MVINLTIFCLNGILNSENVKLNKEEIMKNFIMKQAKKSARQDAKLGLCFNPRVPKNIRKYQKLKDLFLKTYKQAFKEILKENAKTKGRKTGFRDALEGLPFKPESRMRKVLNNTFLEEIRDAFRASYREGFEEFEAIEKGEVVD